MKERDTMQHLIEIHILQNFAPSNLNRDDTGSPKDAIFGGYRRARISSQSLKRAMREYVRDHPQGLAAEDMAVRTKQVVGELVELLTARGRVETESQPRVVAALGGVGLKFEHDQESDTYQAQYLLFMGRRELERLAELIDQHWDQLDLTAPEPGAAKATGKAGKQAARKAVPKAVTDALKRVLDGGKAVDLALFGRMLADLPEKNQDAACQVAHALSTHAVEREFDFYTAVDDVKDLDVNADAGAGMLGTIEFNSACFYRYVALDLAQLRKNLQGDDTLLLRGVEAFLRALAKAKPTGKQNSFAAHNDPAYIACTVRRDADPRNLANAFERPVGKSEWIKAGLTDSSVQRLEATWQKLDIAYGQAGTTFTMNLSDAPSTVGTAVPSLDALVAETMAAVRGALGV
jgi:CRISPR system Cascade subunit CasC